MTASREAGFVEILASDAVLGENDIRDRDGMAGVRDVGLPGSGPLPLSDPVTLQLASPQWSQPLWTDV